MKVFVNRWLRLSGLFLLFTAGLTAQAQTGVTIGASTAPDVSAALDIISTSKGALLPRVADATAILTPAKGLLVFQTGGTPGFYYNAGTSGSPSWQQIATAAGAAITADNGLTKTGQNIALGGTLTGPTTIAQGGNNFSLTGGNVGIGATNPSQRLTVAGNALITGLAGTTTQLIQADASGNLGLAPSLFPASASVPTLTSTTTGLSNPLVAVSGSLAVVLNRGASSLSLYDLTNPASPVLRGTLADGTNLANAVEVAISGSTAAVLCNTANGVGSDIGLVRLFTLGATAPVLVNTLIPPAALSAVNGGLAMSGTKLYVVYDRGASTGYFYVYDVTTPATTSSTPQGTGFPAGGGFTPQSLAVAGNFVAVGSLYNGASIMNVSNPAAPVVAGSTGFTGYTGGNDCPVALNANTLCVLHPTAPTLNTYTVSATGVPTLRNTFTTAASPVSVGLNASLALVACRVAGANVLQVIDVSGSTAVLRNTIALNATTNNVVLTPTLALVANGSAANNLQIFNTPFGARTVVVGPDGALTSTPPAAGVDYVQNQTAAAQTGGFNLGGAGTVGGLLTAGSASVAGATSTASLAVTGLAAGSVPFVGSAGAVSQDNANLFFDNTNKRLGIGTAAPAKRLHVDANSDFLRVDNLAQVSNTNSYLVIDNSGNVGKTIVENVAGQVIRLGFNGGSYFENTGNPSATESALRFNGNGNALLMGSAPNGAANFINTVTGSSIALAQAVVAGNGTPARTTDQITLPTGVYRVTVRLCGNYITGSGPTRSGFVKFIVSNNEYSLVETLNTYADGVTTHAEVSDYLNLNTSSTVDFSVRFLRNFSLIDRASPGTGNSYRSLLLIERVR